MNRLRQFAELALPERGLLVRAGKRAGFLSLGAIEHALGENALPRGTPAGQCMVREPN
jgi:hypothetical protein